MEKRTIYIIIGIVLVIGLVWWFKFRKVEEVQPEVKEEPKKV